MDLAKSMLLKTGWKEGKGLGKSETGIKEALKPKLKFDTSGIGHRSSEEAAHRWWEHAYNAAANNIAVIKTSGGNTRIERVNSDSVALSTKKFILKEADRKQLEYGVFRKSAILTREGQIVSLTPSPEEINTQHEVAAALTDEQLFRACGGRTAHKAARHGLKLSGKLARIEEQDRNFMEKWKAGGNPEDKVDMTQQNKDKESGSIQLNAFLDRGGKTEEENHIEVGGIHKNDVDVISGKRQKAIKNNEIISNSSDGIVLDMQNNLELHVVNEDLVTAESELLFHSDKKLIATQNRNIETVTHSSMGLSKHQADVTLQAYLFEDTYIIPNVLKQNKRKRKDVRACPEIDLTEMTTNDSSKAGSRNKKSKKARRKEIDIYNTSNTKPDKSLCIMTCLNIAQKESKRRKKKYIEALE